MPLAARCARGVVLSPSHAPNRRLSLSLPSAHAPPPLFFSLTRRSATRVAYVESIARTEALSLTGRLLYGGRLADLFFVQWPELAARLPRAVYAGRLF